MFWLVNSFRQSVGYKKTGQESKENVTHAAMGSTWSLLNVFQKDEKKN